MIGYPWYGPEYEGFSGPFDQRPVEPRCLTFTGAPLERDVEVSGPVRATLFVSSSAPDTDWVVRLSDVSPDGTARPVAEGILRARYCKSPVVERLTEPGEVYEVQVDLWSTSNLSGGVIASGSSSPAVGFQDGTGISTPAARSGPKLQACQPKTRSTTAAAGLPTSLT